MSESKLNRRDVLAGFAASAAALSLPLPALAGDPEVLTFANPFPEQTPMGAALGRWKKAVMGRNDGKFKMKILQGDAVGGQGAVAKAVKNGKYAGAMVSTYGLRELVPRLQVLDLPYLFGQGDPAAVEKALKAAKPDIKVALENNGLKLIWLYGMGRRVVVSRGQKFAAPNTMRDKKVGCRPGAQAPSSWEAFGAKAVPTTFAEIPKRLQSGLVEAVDLNLYEAHDLSWSNPDKTVSLTYHAVDVGFLIMGLETFDKLKGKEQEALVSDRAQQQDAITKHIGERESKIAEVLRGLGYVVHAPAPKEREMGAQNGKVAHDAWLKDHKASKKIYDAVRAAL